MAFPPPRGRGAAANSPNRFERLHLELEEEHAPDRLTTEFYRDDARSILSENDSPDLGFRFSINPYRGCEHGCIYCYARPSHEYLGFSGGLDFETRILIKENAPHLLRDALRKRSWEPQVVALSGNTDPYQPVERRLQLTRRCLEVFREYGNPVTITTKNHLVSRDTDILSDLATLDLVRVTLSITSLRGEVARAMEPRASAPERRLEAVEHLARRGVPVGVNVAPLVPGLTDDELPSILEAASSRGASWANCLVLRLAGCVEDLFLD
jgi:DNA repair photolyase